MITTVTDIGAEAATKPVVALAYLALVRRVTGCAKIPPGFRDRVPHFAVHVADKYREISPRFRGPDPR
jgi:hypothetical protein